MSEITEKRLHSLTRRYFKKHAEMPIDWVNFALWMRSSVRPYVIYSSWAAYRHCFYAVCPSEEAKGILRDSKAPGRSSIKPRGSRQRRKRFSPDDRIQLEEYVNAKKKSKWAIPTMVWMRCGLFTGLRPHEWRFVVLDDDACLIVKNVKLNKTTVKDWPSRVLPLAHLHGSEIRMIRRWIETVRLTTEQGDAGFEKLYEGCRHWLQTANRNLWPRRRQKLQLMSARHQFIADLKANGFAATEIAYLVGHGNDARSYESYGATSIGTVGANLPAADHISKDDFDRISKKLKSNLSRSFEPKIIKQFRAINS